VVANVAAVGPDKLTPNQTDVDTQYLKFTVTNEGNSTQYFRLTFDVTGSTLATALSDVIIVADANGDDDYAEADDGAVDIAGTYPSFAADDEVTYFIVARDTAADLLNGQAATYHLIATADNGSGSDLAETGSNGEDSDDIVFAEPAGSFDSDEAFEGWHSDDGVFTVQTASLTVGKTVAVYDTGNSLPTDTYALPGSIMTYTISITNAAGSQTAGSVTLIDEIPANTSFYVDSGPTGGTYRYANEDPFDAATSAWNENPTSTDGVDTDVTAIEITTADITAGNSVDVTFKVKIQ
jgi:uncharacterized repeat protein (TIGR01451 family)